MRITWFPPDDADERLAARCEQLLARLQGRIDVMCWEAPALPGQPLVGGQQREVTSFDWRRCNRGDLAVFHLTAGENGSSIVPRIARGVAGLVVLHGEGWEEKLKAPDAQITRTLPFCLGAVTGEASVYEVLMRAAPWPCSVITAEIGSEAYVDHFLDVCSAAAEFRGRSEAARLARELAGELDGWAPDPVRGELERLSARALSDLFG